MKPLNSVGPILGSYWLAGLNSGAGPASSVKSGVGKSVSSSVDAAES